MADGVFGASQQRLRARWTGTRRPAANSSGAVGGAADNAAGNHKKDIELLESGAKREIVKALSQEYPIKVVCDVLDYSRSQVYYEGRPRTDAPNLEAEIVAIAGTHPTYGYRRITEELKRRGQVVNHKRIAR